MRRKHFGRFCARCAVAATLLVAGVLLAVLVPRALQAFINSSFVNDGPRAALYESFRNNTAIGATVLKKNYFFNLRNKDAVLAGLEMPRLEEVGPWVYQEVKVYPEESTVWLPNGTLQYRHLSTYRFRADLSGGRTEQDLVTLPSLGLQGALKIIRMKLDAIARDNAGYGNRSQEWTWGNQSKLIAAAQLFMTLTDEPFFTTRTVHEMLNGYEDPYLKLLVDLGETDSATVAIAPDSPVNCRDGTGHDEMWSGGPASKESRAPPPKSVGGMTMWHGYRTLPYWGTPEANELYGTDGTSFHPDLEEGEALTTFVDSLKRRMTLCYRERINWRGAVLYRHVMCPSELENQTVNPRNAAYNMVRRGILPGPMYGPASALSQPYFFSKPHYLDADTSDLHVVFVGANTASQDREAYDTFLDVEPHTGSLFHVHKRMQVNTMIGPFVTGNPNNMSDETYVWPITRGINATMYPVVWIDEASDLPDDLLDKFKTMVYLPIRLATGVGVTFAVVGFLLALHTFYGWYCGDAFEADEDTALESGAVDGSAYYASTNASPAVGATANPDELYQPLMAGAK